MIALEEALSKYTFSNPKRLPEIGLTLPCHVLAVSRPRPASILEELCDKYLPIRRPIICRIVNPLPYVSPSRTRNLRSWSPRWDTLTIQGTNFDEEVVKVILGGKECDLLQVADSGSLLARNAKGGVNELHFREKGSLKGEALIETVGRILAPETGTPRFILEQQK